MLAPGTFWTNLTRPEQRGRRFGVDNRRPSPDSRYEKWERINFEHRTRPFELGGGMSFRCYCPVQRLLILSHVPSARMAARPSLRRFSKSACCPLVTATVSGNSANIVAGIVTLPG